MNLDSDKLVFSIDIYIGSYGSTTSFPTPIDLSFWTHLTVYQINDNSVSYHRHLCLIVNGTYAASYTAT